MQDTTGNHEDEWQLHPLDLVRCLNDVDLSECFTHITAVVHKSQLPQLHDPPALSVQEAKLAQRVSHNNVLLMPLEEAAGKTVHNSQGASADWGVMIFRSPHPCCPLSNQYSASYLCS